MARIDNRGNLRGSLQNRSGMSTGRQSRIGADDFLTLSKRLKEAGEKGLRNELNKVMRNAAKPLIPKVREAARDNLPKKGGLNERIAKKPYRAQTRTGANTAGVRIVGMKVDPRINAQGRILHPVFGRKGKNTDGKKNFVVQVDERAKGYFDETLEREGPEIRDQVVKAMSDFRDGLAGRL